MSKDYSTTSSRPQGYRPNLGKVEVQRRRKLESILPDVRTVLDAALADPDCHARLVDRVAPLVAALVAEIAVLDRQTDATDQSVIRRYGRIIAQALDLGDEPWRAISLWKAAATAPLQRFAQRWTQHLMRAERDSESRHMHEKLVDLAQISAGLNLTRPRIRAIFGTATCALPPARMTERTFTLEEQRDIRALARRVGYTPERLRDLALERSSEAFCDRMLVLELLILPDMEKYRRDTGSDVSVSRSLRRLGLTGGKPGPALKAGTRTAQIEAVARHRRVSPSTIKRVARDYRIWLETPEMPDSAVTVIQSSCHSDPEFPAVGFRDFAPLSNSEIPESLVLYGVTINEPDLLMLASLPRHEGPRARVGRKRYDYADKEVVIAWWIATHGDTPSPGRIRQWAHRGWYHGYRESALLWQVEQEIRAVEDADEVRRTAVILPFRTGVAA